MMMAGLQLSLEVSEWPKRAGLVDSLLGCAIETFEQNQCKLRRPQTLRVACLQLDTVLVFCLFSVIIFLLLLLAAALILMYLHHHRYKGSYHTNEPKAVQDYNNSGEGGGGAGGAATPAPTPAAKPATKPAASRKDQNLPQILEESKTE